MDGITVDGDDAQCPQCRRWFKESGVAGHFSKSDCEWPMPTREREELLLGFSLCGVHVRQHDRSAQLRKSGPLPTLEYYCDRLGWWCANIYSREKPSEYPTTETGDESVPQHTLYTRTCPWVRALHDIPLEDWTLHPVAAHTLITFKGYHHEGSLVIRHRDSEAFAQLLRKESFDGFTVYSAEDDTHEHRLRFTKAEAERFLEFSGTEPVPGKEAKWEALAALV